MKALWRWLAAVASVGTLLVAAASGGCGSSRTSSGGGGGGGGGGGELPAAPASALNLEIVSADFPAAGKPAVRFRATDAQGAAINVSQEIANDAASSAPGATPVYPRMRPRFTLARLDEATNDYASYYISADGQATPLTDPLRTGAFPTGQLFDEGGGVWRYEFTQPFTNTGLTPGGTNRVGMFATRTLAPADPATELPPQAPASATFDFAAGGGTAAARPQTVADTACNTCHTPAMQAHGTRRGTLLCVTCHSGGVHDPTTQNSIAFREMIHKIHYGSQLPTAFTIGTTSFADVVFPRDIKDCTACHQGPQADRWKTAGSQAACTSCHEVVKFDGSGTGSCALGTHETTACNHFSIGSTACTTCHVAGNPGIGVDVVHTPIEALAAAYGTEVVSLATDASGHPTVVYRVFNPTAGAPGYDVTVAQQFNVQIGWEQPEFTNAGSGSTAPAQPIRLAGTGATAVQGQTDQFQVASATAAIPAAVKNVRVWVEGHPVVNGVNIPVVNSFKDFPVNGGSITPRRAVVETARCNACHKVVSAHGANRNGETQVCVVCHNPKATDQARSSAAPGGPQPEQTIDFKVLIHAIHGADIRDAATYPFVVWGFGPPAGTPPVMHTFPAGFPGTTGNCAICHADRSFSPPLAPEVLPSTLSAATGTTVPPLRASCTACHAQTKFEGDASLPKCNAVPRPTGDCQHSGQFPITAADDTSCASCHQAGGPADVSVKHPVYALPTP